MSSTSYRKRHGKEKEGIRMEQKVRILDENTANQIAAGEVVEKPASVVKELVENALDAGATSIEVTIMEGGIEFIRVVDNGCGMDEENAVLALQRHATSKITSAQDLQRLDTLGFRGEALPSIASVSHFSLLTRPADCEFATLVTVDGGKKLQSLATGGSIGTSVTVEELFFNVPARRKFLKTITTEGRYINDILCKIALSRPDVRFVLINNGKEILSTPGNGDDLATIAAVYGRKLREELLNVDYSDNGISVTGYISKPTTLKGTRSWQTFFVNGRTINNKMLAKAVDHAFQSQIPKTGFPFALLRLNIDASQVDVNVHPQKSEIKFSDDSAVYRTVFHALGNALQHPLSGEQTTASVQNDVLFTSGNKPQKSATSYQGSFGDGERAYNSIWKVPDRIAETPVIPFIAAQKIIADKEIQPEPVIDFQDSDNGVDRIWPLGQIARTFIVAQSETSLYLIDQHAAHERIMYDKLVKAHQDIPCQELLLPIFIDALPQEIALYEEKKDIFAALGVLAEAGGDSLLRVSALPVDIQPGEAEEFFRDIFTLLNKQKDINPADLRKEVLHYAACHSAIRAGELLSINQMRKLILELLNTEHPFTCPHGRPCMVEMDTDELFKLFKRT